MTNRQKFIACLTTAYQHLFTTSDYTFASARTTPEDLAMKMADGIYSGGASIEGEGIKRACKACAIKQTFKGVRAFFDGGAA